MTAPGRRGPGSGPGRHREARKPREGRGQKGEEGPLGQQFVLGRRDCVVFALVFAWGGVCSFARYSSLAREQESVPSAAPWLSRPGIPASA